MVQDFFRREAFLTGSGQLNFESCCPALMKVYTFGPTFPFRGVAVEGLGRCRR
jgi:aspartyl/asparaginyl-tRNA synthetase